ncbi:cellulose-binding protein [Streptomyces sp. NPDC048639]|uniref:cellulose-binding protein n=1 Tax=Streptomyces sp. NPDC048639 TaxID=3365581 RepID=UPI00371E773D
MSASVSPQGFTAVRGRERGYRPEQVDRIVGGLSASRDETWERAARLTVLVKEMEEKARHLREAAESLPQQTYEGLGTRAQDLLSLAESQSVDLRDAAEAAGHEVREEADAFERTVREHARGVAMRVRGDAEAWAERCRVVAQQVADEMRVTARRDAKELRTDAVAALKEMRERCGDLLADQEKEQAARWDEAGRELAEQEAGFDARVEELVERSEAGLAQAQRRFAEVDQAARYGQEAAEAQAADLLARARAWEERVVEETEAVLGQHAERRDEVRRHLDHVRGSLAALSVRVPEGSQGGREEVAETGSVPGPSASAED